jgi:fructoselysine-6-P-deglycase FrlB-like protein
MDYRLLLAAAGGTAFLIGAVKLLLNSSSKDSSDSVAPSVLTRINAEYNDTRH